jgi:subtilisin family serine protease
MKRLLLLAILLIPTSASAQIGPLTGHVNLRFEEEPSPAELDRLARDFRIQEFERRAGRWPVFTAQLPPGADPTSTATALMRRPAVRWAEPDQFADFELHGGYAVDDLYFPEQWHLQNTGQNAGALPTADVHVVPAWETTRGEGIRIAILDTGVDTGHPDLVIVHGVDVIDDDLDPHPDPEQSGAEHGTMVAGLAAARGDNGIGVSGVAPSADLMAFRMLGEGGAISDTYDAFIIATEEGADVINNSWGYTSEECSPVGFVQLMHDAVEYAITFGRGGLGAAVVFSAGNQGCELTQHALHEQDGVIVVGSLNDRDRKFGYSVWGPNLDLMASSGPLGGGGRPRLVTTDLFGDLGRNGLGDDNEYTRQMGGTSGAAPVLSGAIALMYGANPRLTWTDVEEVLCETALRVSPERAEYDATGWSYTYGCGRVDAAAAVAAVLDTGPPSAPIWMLGRWAELPEDYTVLRWVAAVDPDGTPVRYELTVVPLVDGDDDDSAGDDGGLAWSLTDTRLDLTGELPQGWYNATLETWDRWGIGGSAATTFRVVEPGVAAAAPAAGADCSCTTGRGGGSGLSLLLGGLTILRRRSRGGRARRR